MKKEAKVYEKPQIEVIGLQVEGTMCWSALEKLEEKEGDWGW